MHHGISGAPWLTMTLLLAACGAGTTTSGAGSPVAVSASPSPSVASSEPSASGTPLPTAEPSGGAGFACDLPVHGSGTVARANITDVRVGTHDGYDRIVFQFRGGIPEFDIASARPPFTADPSGQPLTVNGSAFLSITLHGGTKQTDSGASSYSGPRNFAVDFPTLLNLVEGGDFEAVSTWYVGLSDVSCLRVSTLTAPDRLVIDLQR
jgi:hypothetical protein